MNYTQFRFTTCSVAVAIALSVYLQFVGTREAIADGRIPAISGVRLGMTSNDALAELRAARLTSIRVGTSWCVSDYLTRGYTGRGHCAKMISADYHRGTLLIVCNEDIPHRPGTAVVTTIALTYPRDVPPEVSAQHLGPPSATDGKKPWQTAVWCYDVACTSLSESLGANTGASLLLDRDGSFTLADNRLASERMNAELRILAAHGIQHPEI